MSSQQFAMVSVDALDKADGSLAGKELLVYLYMSAYRNYQPNIYDNGFSFLCKKMGINRGYLSRCVKALVDAGFVEIVNENLSDGRRNAYKLVDLCINKPQEIVDKGVNNNGKVVDKEVNKLVDKGVNNLENSCHIGQQTVDKGVNTLHIADIKRKQLCDFVYDEALAIAGQKWAIVGKEQTIIDAINANQKLTDDNAIDFIRATADKAQVFKGFITFLADDPSTRKKPVVVEYDKDGYHPNPFIPNAQPKVEESPEEVEAARKAAVEHARQVIQAKKMELV